MKYKKNNHYLTLREVTKINKMFLLSQENEKYKSEEIILGKNIEEKYFKYEWIINRFFEEDLKEIVHILRTNNNIDIYFFTETKRWEEIETTPFGRNNKVIKTKVSYSLQKIFFHEKNEFKEYHKLPWV